MGGDTPGSHIVVTAAVIEQHDRFLVTRRLRGTHLEGFWEFPGGKCGEREPLRACLEREILEELDAEVDVGEEIYSVTHAYAERTVELHFYRCALLGDVKAVLGQEVRWVRRDELRALSFPPADAELIEMLVEGTEGTEGTEKSKTRRNGDAEK